MPIERFDYQDEGDFHQLRQRYRREHLIDLREREGLRDGVVDMQLRRSGAVAMPYQTGTRKGMRGEEALRYWGGESFDVLDVARDGVPLEREMRDLSRDAMKFEQAASVDHGEAGQMAPALHGIEDDTVLDYMEKQVSR